MAGQPSNESKPRKARYTIDFEVEALKALKHLAVDLEVDASDIVKYLVARVVKDNKLRQEVEQDLARQK
jgi:hypothetical protein